MNNNQNPSAANKIGGATNPFARALAETEKRSLTSSPQENFSHQILSNSLTGKNLDKFAPTPEKNLDFQERLAKQKQKEAIRQQRHDQINPTDQLRTLFDSQKQQDKAQLISIREQLHLETKVLKSKGANVKSIEIETIQEVVDPGINGAKYYYTRFQLLQRSIDLLKKNPNSAASWHSIHQGKQKKRRGKFSAGVDMRKGGKSAHDMLHHERSMAYSGQ